MTDQPKWTPGPWAVERNKRTWGWVDVVGPSLGVGGPTQATDLTLADEVKGIAEAHLNAAAPDLYEALAPLYAVAIDRAVDAPEWRDKDTVSVLISIGELRAIRAALAKARGETK